MNEILRMLLIFSISFLCSAVGLEIIVIIFIVANDLFSRKKHSENDEKYKSKGVMENDKSRNNCGRDHRLL